MIPMTIGGRFACYSVLNCGLLLVIKTKLTVKYGIRTHCMLLYLIALIDGRWLVFNTAVVWQFGDNEVVE